MPGQIQTLAVPPEVSTDTLLYAIYQAASSGGGGGGSGTVTAVSFTGGIVSVATPTTTPALTVAGTSGGIPYFSSASTWATSAALAANAIVVGGGAGVAPSTVTTGTGVLSALGINVNSVGSLVVNGEALGQPSSGDLTYCTFPVIPAASGGSGIANTGTLSWNAAASIQGGGVINLGGFGFSVLATGTASLLGVAQTFTAAKTFSTNGAASTAAILLSGAILTGGTGTTNFPHLFIQPSGATAATTWSTSGTTIGVNAATGFAGFFADFRVAGSLKFSIASDGTTKTGDFLTVGTTSTAYFRHASNRLIYSNALGALSQIGLTDSIANPLDAFFTRKAAATLCMGSDAAGVTNQSLTAASRITSDGVGADLTISAGNGRGAAGGTLILSTYDTAGAGTAGTLCSRMTFSTAGAIAFPVVSNVTTETVVSDTTWPVTINGVAYKICLKA